jgi:LacI family repressor for deo operon, udp, cdd, tsx, nupC, and nupG
VVTNLSDLAQQAGVSTATVSRVLSGKVAVSPKTRHAVLAALDVLGYERPERLRPRSAGLVGLIVPELENPVFPAFVQTMEGALSQLGYTPVLCTQSPGGTTEDEYVEMLLNRGVDGIVFVSGLHADRTASLERYQKLRSRGLPIALVNGYAPEVDAPSVSCDDEIGIDLAVGHLLSLGHKRIGLAIGPLRFRPTKRKVDYFRGLLSTRLGITKPDDSVAFSLYTVEGGHAAAGELVASGHTGIVCGSDMMALGAIRAARAKGLRVPEDISVIGSDDSKLIAFTDPPLTTVHQPVTAMSHAAITTLVAEINGTPGSRTEMLFEPELIVRGSTAPVAVKQEDTHGR